MSTKKAFAMAEAIASRHGFQFHRKGRHWVWVCPRNGRKCTSPVSPSDHRWHKNLDSQMRRLALA